MIEILFMLERIYFPSIIIWWGAARMSKLGARASCSLASEPFRFANAPVTEFARTTKDHNSTYIQQCRCEQSLGRFETGRLRNRADRIELSKNRESARPR